MGYSFETHLYLNFGEISLVVHSIHLMNIFDNWHRARKWHCLVLNQISKRFANGIKVTYKRDFARFQIRFGQTSYKATDCLQKYQIRMLPHTQKHTVVWELIRNSNKENIKFPYYWFLVVEIPDSKVHGANMGPTWVLSAPDGPHVGSMKLAIREVISCHDVIIPNLVYPNPQIQLPTVEISTCHFHQHKSWPVMR